MKFSRWIRNTLAAFALGSPSLTTEKEPEKHESPVEHKVNSNLVQGGSLESYDREATYGQRTIAGGPGSQNIYAAYAALSPAEKAKLGISKRGVIRKATVEEAQRAYGKDET